MRPSETPARSAFRVFGLIVLTLLIWGVGLLPAPAAPPLASAWEPRKTWAFVVGLLEWRDGESWAPFPKTNRRDAALVRLLERRGVAPGRIVYLRDREATRARVVAAYRALLDRTAPGDELIVYFCGHGYTEEDGGAWFVTWDAGDDMDASAWPMASVVTDLQTRFKGGRALLLADCCYSGVLAERARETKGTVAIAALTSSTSKIPSTANWTFTESVLAALSGSPVTDLDHDGAITLDEMARYTRAEMRFGDDQQAAFLTTRGYDAQEVMAPTHGTAKPREGERIEVKAEGQWWKARILDSDGRRVRVHYYGYETSDDEWVDVRRVRSAP